MEENKNPELEVRETDKEGNSGVEESLAENNESIEAENVGSGKKGGRGMVSTRNGLYLRTVIGGLILYYAYTIISDTSRTMLYVFVEIFGIAGVWIILDSLKRLFKKEYDE